MTEELEQKAEKYAIENYERCIYDDVRGWENDFRARKEAYIAGATETTKELEKRLAEAVAIIKIAREAYIKSGIYTMNSEPVYKEEVKRLYALFFDRAEAFINKE